MLLHVKYKCRSSKNKMLRILPATTSARVNCDFLRDFSGDIDSVANAGHAHIGGVLLDNDTADAAEHRR